MLLDLDKLRLKLKMKYVAFNFRSFISPLFFLGWNALFAGIFVCVNAYVRIHTHIPLQSDIYSTVNCHTTTQLVREQSIPLVGCMLGVR